MPAHTKASPHLDSHSRFHLNSVVLFHLAGFVQVFSETLLWADGFTMVGEGQSTNLKASPFQMVPEVLGWSQSSSYHIQQGLSSCPIGVFGPRTWCQYLFISQVSWPSWKTRPLFFKWYVCILNSPNSNKKFSLGLTSSTTQHVQALHEPNSREQAHSSRSKQVNETTTVQRIVMSLKMSLFISGIRLSKILKHSNT